MKRTVKKKLKNSAKKHNWIYLVSPLVVLVGGLASLLYFTLAGDVLKSKENAEANLWRVAYWKAPIPFQGEVPENFHPLARDLSAKRCAQCHPTQYEDWSASLHSKAMGPGIAGQYPPFSSSEKAGCDVCHAPMSEQAEELRVSGEWTANTKLNQNLQQEGVTCAACHLRKHQRNAPPQRTGKQDDSELEELSAALHGKPLRTKFFETSEFCRGCHQHEANTLKISGNTIENTYIEWLKSPAYDAGKTCQSCHMPDRKHLWKGIHDKEMTTSGVRIEHTLSTENPKTGEVFRATLKLSNTGSGHRFPTYTTPAVYLKAAFLDKDAKVVSGDYFEQHIIQRRLNMSNSPWTEYFDTRLASGESAELVFEKTIPPEAVRFKLWIWVKPDQFYEGFYKRMISNKPKHAGLAQFQEALVEAKNRQYALFTKELEIYAN